jgi:hypothetical protein
MKRSNWTFSEYIEEIILLSEIAEIPGMTAKRSKLIGEVWQRYPEVCEAFGLLDRPQNKETANV